MGGALRPCGRCHRELKGGDVQGWELKGCDTCTATGAPGPSGRRRPRLEKRGAKTKLAPIVGPPCRGGPEIRFYTFLSLPEPARQTGPAP